MTEKTLKALDNSGNAGIDPLWVLIVNLVSFPETYSPNNINPFSTACSVEFFPSPIGSYVTFTRRELVPGVMWVFEMEAFPIIKSSFSSCIEK